MINVESERRPFLFPNCILAACGSLRGCLLCRGQPLCGKTIKIRVKNREPLPSYAMEMSDEYQDMGNPGGGVAVVNIPMAHHQHSPDSPLVSVFIFFFFNL